MGTRSLTVFKELRDGDVPEEIVVMYRQMDGYPSGHGTDLAKFLLDMTIVNGLSYGDGRKVANGMSCLSAQVIAYFKEEPGGIYLHKAGTRDAGEEYVYSIEGRAGKELMFRVFESTWEETDSPGDYNIKEELIFEGTPEDFLVDLEKGVLHD